MNPNILFWRRKEREPEPIRMPLEEPGEAPAGWYLAVGYSGASGGLGFHCTKCHLAIPCHAPDVVKHCGREDHKPTDTTKLPSYTIGSQGGTIRALRVNHIRLDDDEDVFPYRQYDPGF